MQHGVKTGVSDACGARPLGLLKVADDLSAGVLLPPPDTAAVPQSQARAWARQPAEVRWWVIVRTGAPLSRATVVLRGRIAAWSSISLAGGFYTIWSVLAWSYSRGALDGCVQHQSR